MELGYFIETVLDFFSPFIHFFFLFLQLSAVFQQGLVLFLVLEVFFGQGHFLGFDLLFQLVDLVVDDLVSALQFGDFVFGL